MESTNRVTIILLIFISCDIMEMWKWAVVGDSEQSAGTDVGHAYENDLDHQ